MFGTFLVAVVFGVSLAANAPRYVPPQTGTRKAAHLTLVTAVGKTRKAQLVQTRPFLREERCAGEAVFAEVGRRIHTTCHYATMS